MNARAAIVRPSRALFAVAGVVQRAQRVYQGWIEANLIFVAPDEVGRVQTLSVREGDVVKAGDRYSRSTTICRSPTSPRSRPR